MSKEYYVLRGGRVVFRPGHYDIEGARAIAKREAAAHPMSTVTVVQIMEQYGAVRGGGNEEASSKEE